MIYQRTNIHDLLKDTKNFIKAPHKPRWCVVCDEDGKEYVDDNYWLTDGFALWLVPSATTSKFRLEYEKELLKMQDKKELIRRPKQKSLAAGMLKKDEYELATVFELDFHPLSGFSVLCKAGETEARLDMLYLFKFDDLAREFDQLKDYEIEVAKDNTIVRIVKDHSVLGVSAPIIGQENIPY